MKTTIHKAGVGLVALLTALVGMTTAAYASTSPLDGVATEANNAKTEFANFVTGTAVPILFALLVLGVGIALAVKYVRRGARAA